MLSETTTIPEHNYVITKGTATIQEAGNAVPYTGKLEALSEFDISNATTVVLRNDMAKVLDSLAATQFLATEERCVLVGASSNAFTTNGTFTATATANLNAYHVRAIIDRMLLNNVPPFDGEYYVCIGSVGALSGLFADVGSGGWVDVSKYTEYGIKNIFAGEVGTYYKCRFVRETNRLSSAIGASSLYGQSVFFGGDAVMELIVNPEEIRAKIPQDYGRDKGLAWYWMGGYQIIWQRSADSEFRIIFVGSA